MARHVAGVVAVIAATLWLAAGGSSNLSGNQSASPPPAIRCTAAQGVHYDVERNNKTNKTVLKILVKDRYHAEIPPAPVTPPPTPPETPSEAPMLAPSPTSQTTTKTTSTEATEMTLTSTPPSESEENWMEREGYKEFALDDWDYMEQSNEEKIIKPERERHPVVWPPFISHHTEHPEGWQEFCTAAADEDEEPVIVLDGSFHPRYEEVPGVGVYRLHARPRSWDEARNVCEREGAQLAVPNSREEALALAEIHNRCPRILHSHFNDYQYLGAHDEFFEGRWETIVGYPLNETGYVNWAFNQPDNAHHKGENCLTMNRNGFYNDVPCWTELPFICEHA